MELILGVAAACWQVLGEMAPYLLFGFLISGVMYVFISPEWVERHLGGRGLLPVLKSALLGVPLPLCSCGVIPVAASIRAHGASRGATLAFLLSTPQTGLDSMLATYALLGPVFAIYRPVVALITGVLGGGMAALLDPEQELQDSASPASSHIAVSGGRQKLKLIKEALHYGLVALPRDIARPLLLGILIAGVISIFVSENALAPYLGGGIWAMLAMAAVGIPLYVCATASIPLALGFMHMGASPGAALVFLIAGPATNAATISVVWKVLGRRTALIYLGTVAFTALGAGLSLDAIFKHFPEHGMDMAGHAHVMGASWLGHVWAAILLAVLAASLWPRKKMAGSETKETKMEHAIKLRINGMTCSHCANAVGRALRESAGVTNAEVNLDAGEALVAGEGVDKNALVAAIEKLGYEAIIETA